MLRKSKWLLLLLIVTSGALGNSLLPYFEESYEAARKDFRELSAKAKKLFQNTQVEKFVVPSRVDADLTIDSVYIPAQSTPKGLVVVVSGIHGAEAYAGSAVQRMVLDRLVLKNKKAASDVGYLFVHSMNPYGFKYGRRVTENNVDLNRNMSTDRKLFENRSSAYGQLNPILNPPSPASDGWFRHGSFLYQVGSKLLSTAMSSLRQAIAQGQYEHEKGIFFGGRDFEPQKSTIESLLLNKSARYGKVLILDLHTGFGRRGFMHLFPNPPDTAEIGRRMKQVFANYPIEDSGPESKDFYSNDGDFSTFASRLLEKQGKRTVPMLIEYGTLDSQTYTGSIRSLRRMILENQLHWFGAEDDGSAVSIHENFREMFFPSDPKWRDEIMGQSMQNLPEFIDRFRGLDVS